MSISLDDIRAFLSVAKHESFVMAADELCITPPALSRRIKKLEEFVGDPLFDRTTQMVAITSSGQVLLERAQIVVREFETFKDFAGHFARDHVIRIRFACMWSTAGSVVPGLIRDYAQLHENAEFEVSENNADTVARLVRERQVDFGISMRPDVVDDLEFTPLCDDPVVLACPPGHQLFERTEVSWAELQAPDARKIDWGVMRSIAMGSFAHDLRKADIPVERGVMIAHLSTQLGFLEAHLKAIIMPLLGCTLSRAPDIKCIPIREPAMEREIGIVTLRNAKASRAVASFLDHVQLNFFDHYEAAISRFES